MIMFNHSEKIDFLKSGSDNISGATILPASLLLLGLGRLSRP